MSGREESKERMIEKREKRHDRYCLDWLYPTSIRRESVFISRIYFIDDKNSRKR